MELLSRQAVLMDDPLEGGRLMIMGVLDRVRNALPPSDLPPEDSSALLPQVTEQQAVTDIVEVLK